MPQTQAPNHQGGSRHQGPLCAALNTRGGSNIPPRGLNCGCFAVFSTQHHTEVQAAHPRHSSSFPPLQAEEQLPSLETWPGLISCVLFRACSLAPTVFSRAYHTLRACARDRERARLPRGMAVRVALLERPAHRAPSSDQNSSSGHSHSKKYPVCVAWAILSGDTRDLKPCTRACTRWLAPRCCRSCGLRGKRLKRHFTANVWGRSRKPAAS